MGESPDSAGDEMIELIVGAASNTSAVHLSAEFSSSRPSFPPRLQAPPDHPPSPPLIARSPRRTRRTPYMAELHLHWTPICPDLQRPHPLVSPEPSPAPSRGAWA